MSFFTYINTYNNDNSLQSFINNLDSRNIQNFSDASQCAYHATINNSKVFLLNNYNDSTNGPDVSCLYYPFDYNITDASLIDNITSLTKCNSPNNVCYKELSNNKIGVGENAAIYITPSILVQLDRIYQDYLSNNITSTIDEFNEIYREINDLKDIYKSKQIIYLEFFYQYISGESGDGQYTYIDPTQNETADEYYKEALNSTYELEEKLFELNELFNKKLIQLEDLNNTLSQRYILVEITDLKINNAKQFFNILMNKNQGAIGELDISNYNKLLSLFQNVIISIIIFYSIYLYYKKK